MTNNEKILIDAITELVSAIELLNSLFIERKGTASEVRVHDTANMHCKKADELIKKFQK